MSASSCIGTSALIMSALAAGSARATEIHCPASISERSVAAAADKQWTVVAKPGEREVEHAGVYLDVAGEFAAQVPDSIKTSPGKEEWVTWRLAASGTETFAIGCSYTGTSAMLFKKLDRGTAQCVATYTLLPTGRKQHLKSVDCQ